MPLAAANCWLACQCKKPSTLMMMMMTTAHNSNISRNQER
eukprot:13851.XXX_215747_215866_1 [CDS] Oithona nana genome sequencing.